MTPRMSSAFLSVQWRVLGSGEKRSAGIHRENWRDTRAVRDSACGACVVWTASASRRSTDD
jgi:hypothetical protein